MDEDEIEFVLEDADMIKQIVLEHLVGVKVTKSEYTSNGITVHENLCGRCCGFICYGFKYCSKCGGLLLW